MANTTLKDLDFQSDRGFEMVYFRHGSPPLFKKETEWWEVPVTKYSLAVEDRYNELVVDNSFLKNAASVLIVDFVYEQLREGMGSSRDLHGS